MVRKAFILFSWFPLALVLVLNCLFYLSAKNKPVAITPYLLHSSLTLTGAEEVEKSTSTGKMLSAVVSAEDGRHLLLNNFLLGSPLEPYTNLFISEADKYNIDYRLIPAIAMCESNLGKHIPSQDSFNAYGIAVYTGQNSGAKFTDWPSSIKWVYKFINDKFMKNNIIDIKEIGATWAPPSVEKGHSWANCVEKFMRSIQ